jgi:hypothetical protein
MAFIRLPINSLSGGVGRQSPTKRLTTEAENIDNCLVTLERSAEKRPPLSSVNTGLGGAYLDIPFLNPPLNLNFNLDNLYFHFLDIDGFNRYCIIINRAGYDFEPSSNYISPTSGEINLSNFITVYRIEPTEWVKETVDSTIGTTSSNTSGFNRAIFEYLTYGNKSITTNYKVARSTVTNVSPASIKDTFGSTDFDVGIILWNKRIEIDYLPDNSALEIVGIPSTGWGGTFATNNYIHSGDVINYKVSTGSGNSPQNEDLVGDTNYLKNVRDDINLSVDSTTQEVVDIGQSKETFEGIPQFPVATIQTNLSAFCGYRATRTLNDLVDAPRIISLSGGNINFSQDDYYLTSPLTALDRGAGATNGYGRVFVTRDSYLSFPVSFYRTTRYERNPYYERVRSESPNSVFDHRRLPIIIYKDVKNGGLWRVRQLPVQPRKSGTNLSNPGPTAFTRKETIQSITVWKNRLWVATENTIFASKLNNYFDWWVNDVNNLTETDPIDIQASVGVYNKLTYLVPFQSTVFVSTAGSLQFEIRGGSADVGISPFNVEFRPTSFYSTSKLTEPQKLGNNIFFANSGKMYMYLGSNNASSEYSTAVDVSQHCKDYLPDNIRVLSTSSSTDSIHMVNDNIRYQLYNFVFRTNGEKIAQNAFHRWILSPEDDIVALKSYEKDLYLLSKRPATANSSNCKVAVYFTSLETVPFTTPMIDWLTLITPAFMNFDGTNTTLSLPFYDPRINHVIKSAAWGNDAYTDINIVGLSVDSVTGYTKVIASGKLTTNSVWVGRSYEMSIELSQQVIRGAGDGSANVVEGVLNLKRLTTKHLNTGSYDLVIQRNGRPTTTVTFFPFNINSLQSVTGNIKIDGVGEHFTKILSFSESCKIFVKCPYPTPCNITNIDIIGNWRPFNTGIE